MSAPLVIGGAGPVYARATWAVYSPRALQSPFVTHPVKRPGRGHNGIDGGVVTRRMLRSDARWLAARLRRLGVTAHAFRVADGCEPGDVGSGWES